ncbi:MAG TPA: SE1832 family protein [Chondromyces sp.]|nr:SE1832 family protein [Chondromyces sp.]
MNKPQLENKIAELKMDYIRIQGDIEKLESVGRNTSAMEKKLIEMEEQLKELNEKLIELSLSN